MEEVYQDEIVTLMDEDFEGDKRGSFLGRTTKTQQLRQAANSIKISNLGKKITRPRSFANTPSKSKPMPIREAIDGDYLRNAVSATGTPVAAAPRTSTAKRCATPVEVVVNAKAPRVSAGKKVAEIKKSISAIRPKTTTVTGRVPIKPMPKTVQVVKGAGPHTGNYGKNTFGSGSAEQKASKLLGSKSALPSSVITAKAPPTTATTNDFVFKARKMPNFNKGVVVANKENKVNRPTAVDVKNTISERKPMTNINLNKPAFSGSTLINKQNVSSRASMLPNQTKTVGIVDKKRNHRQSMFTSQNKDRRMSNIAKKRFQ